MEYLNYIILALGIGYILWRLMPAKGVNQITTGELRKVIKDKDKQFVDVRTVDEFRGNKISGFKNIPLNELKEKGNSLNKDKEVVVICQSGMRSSQACRLLKKMGFKEVTNVKGGMSAW